LFPEPAGEFAAVVDITAPGAHSYQAGLEKVGRQ
jgi:hypothetical protein